MNDVPAPLDAQVIGSLRELQDGGAPGFLAELIDLFLAQGVERLGELRDALRARNGPGLARVAHTLKGSAGSLGASHLRTLCAALEDDLRAGDWEASERRTREIEAEFRRVDPALRAERDR